MSEKQQQLFGLIAEFNTVDEIIAAAEQVRDAGFKFWDTHTPFPVHGLSDAMGIRPTKLPLFSLGGGLTGVAIGLLIVYSVAVFGFRRSR